MQAAVPSTCPWMWISNRMKINKWESLIWLAAAFFTHQGGRVVFGVVLPQVKVEMNLSDTQAGLIGSCLFAVLAVSIPIAGFLGDRFSRKLIITLTLIIGSLAMGLAGFATGLLTLLLFYSVTSGACEAIYAPPAYSLIAAIHTKTRALAMSIHQAGLYIGVMSCGFIAGGCMDRWGWRSAYWVYSLIGVVLGVIVLFRLREPAREITVSPAETFSMKETVVRLVKRPSALLATAGFTAVVFANNAFWFWMPVFLQKRFAIDMSAAGGNVLFYHNLAAIAAIIAGGLLTDRIVPKDPSFRLKLQTTALLCGAPLIFLIPRMPTPGLTWLLVAGYGLFRGFFECNTHTALFDVVPKELRSSAAGLMTMVAFLTGAFAPFLLGLFRDILGPEKGILLGFSLLAGFYVLGAVAVFCSLRFTFKKDYIGI